MNYYQYRMSLDAKERNALRLRFYGKRMIRESSFCNWPLFCEELYKVLFIYAMEGVVGTEKIIHQLFKSSGIDATVIAQQRGFKCFDEMLYSKSLEHVVTIEYTKKDHSNWIEYCYRPALNPNHFVQIRKMMKKKMKKPFFDPSMKGSSHDSSELTNKYKEIRAKPSNSSKRKEIRGALISYEADADHSSNNEFGEEGQEEREGKEEGWNMAKEENIKDGGKAEEEDEGKVKEKEKSKKENDGDGVSDGFRELEIGKKNEKK